MPFSWKHQFFHIFLLLVSCRHIKTKTPGPTPPPLAPISPLPTADRSVVFKGESHTEKLEVLNPVSLTLECVWAGNHPKLPNITGFWKKDGEAIENSHLTVQLENDQYLIKRVFNIVNEESLGSYSCIFGNEAKVDFLLAAPHIAEVRDKPIVSYVGDSVVIPCKMEEPKPKPNTWKWYKDNGTAKEQIFAAGKLDRFEIKNENGYTKLTVHNLTEADSGLYYCGAVYAIATTMSHVKLKVISIQEPLKPFIAIMVEVIILVTAILLYERSQSKKNSTAGNDVNTDQSHIQVQEENSLEENSSMRQRKI
ncbi:embigin [Sphaeramia orbicularis]|uniref:Ig-like domain-containing protein n=1 Tax=Sphaeramia orbicularis TaxID=375764 RepID=A0A673C4S8_9TELE|nr:embigin [Sphaeramia orbicularis]